MIEVGWVIELVEQGPGGPYYWDGRAGWTWTNDHMLAIRFAREIDAERVRKGLNGFRDRHGKVSEHMWYGPDSTDANTSDSINLAKPEG